MDPGQILNVWKTSSGVAVCGSIDVKIEEYAKYAVPGGRRKTWALFVSRSKSQVMHWMLKCVGTILNEFCFLRTQFIAWQSMCIWSCLFVLSLHSPPFSVQFVDIYRFKVNWIKTNLDFIWKKKRVLMIIRFRAWCIAINQLLPPTN